MTRQAKADCGAHLIERSDALKLKDPAPAIFMAELFEEEDGRFWPPV
jgi:hypothetical protein